jgi:hypothetical protein
MVKPVYPPYNFVVGGIKNDKMTFKYQCKSWRKKKEHKVPRGGSRISS